jgi:glycosyltransferase involved in cell wall biosynthesis
VTHSLISIITPCLNRTDFIREAVESVLAQNYPNFEHIVMDGGSTDGTLDILRSYPHLRVVSEPDKGMYDGINKGLRLAHGEIIGLLNTDDLYANGCFDAVVAAFDEHPKALAVVGGITIFAEEPAGPRTIETVPTIEADELWYRLIQGPPVTNAWFFKTAVFERIGYFDDRYRYAADRYFLIRAALDGGVRPVPIHQVLYHYRRHSGSATISNLDSRTPEYGGMRIKVLQEDVEALNEFMARPALPDEVRRRIRREHAERCYRLAATALYHHRWRLALSSAWQGWRRNYLWPLIFLEMAFQRLQKAIRGHE